MRPSNEPTLDAPIPGQSLTKELGSRPWEQAPKLGTVEEVIDEYLTIFDEASKVDYVIGTEKSKKTKPRMSAIHASLKDFNSDYTMPGVEEEQPVEEPEEAPMGMMERRSV